MLNSGRCNEQNVRVCQLAIMEAVAFGLLPYRAGIAYEMNRPYLFDCSVLAQSTSLELCVRFKQRLIEPQHWNEKCSLASTTSFQTHNRIA